ncbi:hypothetical protein Poli38472_006491 [Pythium oligandrum]|uniref:Uncharacterized protein n=1 Tax=Pythium oligandrum TaxID=41045 RepID=A0A8K1C4P7_PYTOL|nr:hypothetical protein Poli38472_006491 [Pythium oligandrum]|eukprot:TMW56481.1 hypothetical protein Poli38472_006491 [Pythium oligandrum]
MTTPRSPSAAVKALSRYACQECGGKELYLYCWKGCRHIDNLKTFYATTKAMQQEMETLKATVYEQTRRIRDMEAQMVEKDQALELITRQIARLPQLRPGSRQPHSTNLSGLPRSSRCAFQLVFYQFDSDQDGKNDEVCESITTTTENVGAFAHEAQLLLGDIRELRDELNEKNRTTTRLREGFAEVKMTLDSKDCEIRQVEHRRSLVDQELRGTKDAVSVMSTDLHKTKSELQAAMTAIQDLRALVEDQVNEKERWQRYCWELEERHYDEVQTSQVKDRDLFKTRDAKKEEARKNMLLYMESQRGKRHFALKDTDKQDCLSQAETAESHEVDSDAIEVIKC